MLWRCKFRPRTERTSLVNLKASKTGNKLRSAVSLGSENQELIGIALSSWKNKNTERCELMTEWDSNNARVIA